MRARNLKPGFFKNEQLADLPPLTRILFEGLWVYADKSGRLEDRPRKIKAELLPYDDCDIVAMLDQLERAGFVKRYSVDSKAFIYLPTFSDHQHPHPKEPDSVIPSPDSVRVNPEPIPETPEATRPLPLPSLPSNNPLPNTLTRDDARAFVADEFPPFGETETLLAVVAEICKQDLERCGTRMLHRLGDCAASIERLEPTMSRNALAAFLEGFGAWHARTNPRSTVPAPEWIPDKWGAFKDFKLNGSRAGPRSHVAELMDEHERLYESYGNKSPEDKPIH